MGELRQIVSDEYDPLLGSPRTWVYWLLRQHPGEYSQSDRDTLISAAAAAAIAHDAETAARNMTGRTRVTYDRWHYSRGKGTQKRAPFFEALESFIAGRTNESAGLNDWLGASQPDSCSAASWAASWAEACAIAHAA